MTAGDAFQTDWRQRLASGSKLAARALATALKEDASRLPSIAPLAIDEHPAVRVSALRALADVAEKHPARVAPHARELVQALGGDNADAQTAALEALGHVAPHASAELALALPLIGECLTHKRPGVREAAAHCLGRLGMESPARAPDAAHKLAEALGGAKGPRQAQEARELLAAIERVVPNLPEDEREWLAARVQPLRGHPNLQVRERAGRLARALAA